MLEQLDASRPEHGDQRVHEAARIGRSVAREHEAGADVVGQGRHEAADIATVQQRARDRGRPAQPCAPARRGSARPDGHRGTGRRSPRPPPRRPRSPPTAKQLGLTAGERGEGGPPSLELPRRGRPDEPDRPARQRRDRARADAQRAVTVHQRAGGVAEHAWPRQRRQQRRAQEAGVAPGRARAQRGRVDNRDLGAALVQRERTGQADQTSADDDDRCRRHGAGRYSGPASGGPEE